jgi:hypothetical protein
MSNIDNEILAGWGAVDTDDNNGGSRQDEKKLDFLNLPEGDTKIRVLDAVPYAYKEWWAPKGNGGQGTSIPYKGKDDLLEAENQKFMQKVFEEADRLGLKDKERKKFLREKGYNKMPWGKVKQKYVIHVLDRATGEVKLLDKGNGVFKELKKYALNPEYGDLRQYDITITRKGSGLETEYSVTPARQNTPLTEAELKLYEECKVDLAKLKGFENVTPEQCLAIAKGATWKEVLGNGSDSAQTAEEKSNENMLPPQEEKAPEKDEQIDIDKGEALTPEELENLEF